MHDQSAGLKRARANRLARPADSNARDCTAFSLHRSCEIALQKLSEVTRTIEASHWNNRVERSTESHGGRAESGRPR